MTQYVMPAGSDRGTTGGRRPAAGTTRRAASTTATARPPSRWDALGPSYPPPSSNPRRRPRNSGVSSGGMGSQDGEFGGGRWGAAAWPPFRPGGRAATNFFGDRGDRVGGTGERALSRMTPEEARARAALDDVENAVAAWIDGGDAGDDGGRQTLDESVERLARSLFGAGADRRWIDPVAPLPKSIVSDDVLWEAGYSLLRRVQRLSQFRSGQGRCFLRSAVGMSSASLACLRSLVPAQKMLLKGASAWPRDMSDGRLCDCASMLLDSLGTFDAELANDEDLARRAILFSCLAKILALSTAKCRCGASHSGSRGARDRRGPLSPWGAERTVYLVVRGAALPFIESVLNIDDTTVIPASAKVKHCRAAIECLALLLRDPHRDPPFDSVDWRPTGGRQAPSKHAAAIFAPLVVDVLSDGREDARANPLRSRTLGAIGRFWDLSCEVVQSRTRTPGGSNNGGEDMGLPCLCMAAALHALRSVGRGKGKKDNPRADVSEINVSAVARQLQSLMQNEDLRPRRGDLLDVLSLLCATFPSASAGQWYLFLERNGGGLPALLSMIDEGASVVEVEKYKGESWMSLPGVLRTTSALLTAVPFSLWISSGTRPTARMMGGNLVSRVSNALLNVMGCTLNLMRAMKGRISSEWLTDAIALSYASSMEAAMEQVSRVAGKLCTILPFNGENSVLLRRATTIVQCAGDIWVDSVKMILSKPSITESELEHTLLYKGILNFGDVMVTSLRVDADTAKVAFSAPVESWLSDASSYDFIGQLLTDSCWKFPSSKERIEMLSSVAQRSPGSLLREPFILASFCELCVVQCKGQNDVDSRFRGLKLIESFLLGRKQLLANSGSNSMVLSVVPETLCPLLQAGLEDHSPAVRACAVSSFGSFFGQDWAELFFTDARKCTRQHQINWASLEGILSLCSADDENNVNVRSSSCKSVGDICTACVGGITSQENPLFTEDFLHLFAAKICAVMTNCLADENASVRSMGLHAIGNLAMALKERYNEISVPEFTSIKRSFTLVCACLSDKDEKVVANSIRSISHSAYFVYTPYNITETMNTTQHDACISLVSDLTSKIVFALEDGAGEMPRDLTWKQRNGAKKHAWGSCNTLGTLLSFTNMLPYIGDGVAGSALLSLFQCIQQSGMIAEKITAAAVKALVKLPIAVWHHMSCKCDTTGRGLATCFGFLEKRKATAHRDDVESLAKQLLISSKRLDFCNLFLIKEEIPFSAEFVYQWLVTNDIEAGVVEEVASAVYSQDVQNVMDVSIAQMFLSRRIQQNRRPGSPCKRDVASMPLERDDEEGDEL